MEDFFAWLITRVIVAAFFSAIGTVAICLFLKTFVLPFTKKRELEQAKEEGRVVTAKLVSMIHPNTNGYGNFDTGYHLMVTGKYRYEYKGRTYTYSEHFDDIAPNELDLYFKKDPAKARIARKFAELESEWKQIFPVLTAIGFVATFFFF